MKKIYKELHIIKECEREDQRGQNNYTPERYEVALKYVAKQGGNK